MPSRVSTRLGNLALAAASTLIFGGLIEGAARLLEPPPVQKEEYLWDWNERFHEGDFYTLERGEGYPPDEETNVDGLRDVSRPVETRDGLTRVMILGDSVVYGHGLLAPDAFPQIMERTLRASGHDIDVFNMALPGWSTRQERIAYERLGRKYKPNLVVLAVCLNDLAELQINLTKPPGLLLSLFKASATVRLALGASKREIGAVEELFDAPDSARVNNAFDLFFKEVIALRDAAEADGASFRLLVFPFRFQLESGARPPTVQKRIADFASAERMDLFDALPEIARSEAPAGLFLDYDHFNRAGHQKVAAWLSNQLGLQAAMDPVGADPRKADPSDRQSARSALARLREDGSEARREEILRTVEMGAPSWRSIGPAPDFALLSAVVLATAVDDPSPRVRFEAARAVLAFGPLERTAVDSLVRGLNHDDPRVRTFATWTLGEMGEAARAAVPALVALARKDGGAGKTGALTAIGKIGGESPETVPFLLEELKHPKENRRYRAARTIGRLGADASAAVPGLIAALRDPSALVRLNVVRALGNLGDAAKAAVPALTERLNSDPDVDVRKEVSLTLSKLPGR